MLRRTGVMNSDLTVTQSSCMSLFCVEFPCYNSINVDFLTVFYSFLRQHALQINWQLKRPDFVNLNVCDVLSVFAPWWTGHLSEMNLAVTHRHLLLARASLWNLHWKSWMKDEWIPAAKHEACLKSNHSNKNKERQRMTIIFSQVLKRNQRSALSADATSAALWIMVLQSK